MTKIKNIMSEMNWMKPKEHFEWLQKCLNCWRLSEEFIFQSIQQGKNIDIINMCRDVAEMCSQCIKFEAQRSPFFQQLCEVCAQICELALINLEEIKNKDQLCLDVIESNKALIISCLEIAQLKKQDMVDDN